MLQGQEITRKTHPELSEAYERFCIDAHIMRPPKLVYDGKTLTAHCRLFDDQHVYIGNGFLNKPLDQQMNDLAHELYHIHEYVIAADTSLDVNIGDKKPKREANADCFAAILCGNIQTSIGSLQANTENREQHRAAVHKTGSKRLIEEANKADAAYIRDHGTDAHRVANLNCADLENVSWAQDIITRRNAILLNREERSQER